MKLDGGCWVVCDAGRAEFINTVCSEPTVRSIAVLAGIVLVRTFLSFSLEVEIDGRWPWQKGATARPPGRTDRPGASRAEERTAGSNVGTLDGGPTPGRRT